nr:hypothetical protein [Tanacetum cinerariifolium]
IQENLDAGTLRKDQASTQQYVLLPLWSAGSQDPQNTDDDVGLDVKENEYEVHVYPSSSAKPKQHDEKAKREAKGKSPIELSTKFKDLIDKFEAFSVNSTNGVNAASTPVTVVGPNLTNNLNSFNVASTPVTAAGPNSTNGPNNFNAASTPVIAVGPDLTNNTNSFSIPGPSNTADPSQYPDDPDMPALEEIIYSDDKEDVSAEADFSNLKTSITVSPFPTTIVHKDHPVIQIIAYASFMGFMAYQMDINSAFLYGTIEEEVYVCQPPGFEDPDYPDKVYKVVKALFGLHQPSRAWYETLANYLVYVNDIIFGSTNKELCKAFEKLMKDKFQMISMGELTFLLGLQIKQKNNEISISQDKYVAEILKKFGFTDGKSANTPIDTEKPLLNDPDDIMFAICACARFQVTPKVSHLHAVKRIFRYLKGKPHLGLWYPKNSLFNLVAYSDSDYAGASFDRNSAIGGRQFLGCHGGFPMSVTLEYDLQL